MLQKRFANPSAVIIKHEVELKFMNSTCFIR